MRRNHHNIPSTIALGVREVKKIMYILVKSD